MTTITCNIKNISNIYSQNQMYNITKNKFLLERVSFQICSRTSFKAEFMAPMFVDEIVVAFEAYNMYCYQITK